MVVSKQAYKNLLGESSDSMERIPIGGRCAANCQRAVVNSDCMRENGGRCVGNCRKTGGSDASVEW